MDVSIIIVNYNTSQLIVNCIESIKEKTHSLTYEIIVVDNHSPNDTLDNLDGIDGVRLINAEDNLGFGRANNIGAKYASGNYLFFLNPDTLLVNNAIEVLFSFLESRTDVGACGGNLLDSDNKPTHSFRRKMPSISNEIDMAFKHCFSRIIYGRNIQFNYTGNPLKVAYITGADLMIPKFVWDKVGGFSDDFFMYYEETELQLRIKKEGYKIVSVPGAEITHLEGKSFDINEAREKRILNGRFVFFHKAYSDTYNRFSDSINLFLYKMAIVYCRIFGKKMRYEKYSVRRALYQEEMKKWA